MAKMKFKVGDKVKLKKDLVVGEVYGGLIYSSDIDKTKIYTLLFEDDDGTYKIRTEKGFRWVTPEMIEYAEDTAPTITEHLVRGNKTIVKLSNGKVGIAKCSPEDKFDVYEGLRVATARAYGREVDEPKKEEPKFKVWDRVRYKWYGFGEGTVIEFNSGNSSSYLVLFDKPNPSLHNNSNAELPPRCWWCSADNLEKI